MGFGKKLYEIFYGICEETLRNILWDFYILGFLLFQNIFKEPTQCNISLTPVNIVFRKSQKLCDFGVNISRFETSSAETILNLNRKKVTY